ncbi:hypothetical protein OV203_08880 [Nannocystis sp. ILAH1]|uniref:hypothetical protein n=1 Tax=unclassified Nannocystis TaxID=2627009 RepID=UPI00226FDA08|nr:MULTISPECIES: hypothetical protein [unclassified Nannocystis]MCY0987235.1 hypothetical protein [Nannocystis sp. ILAH1]MCY1070966.1 hypothetical protein [Nannocystis sp. RBIL2]
MHRFSRRFAVVPLALLAGCPSKGQDTETTAGPDTSSGASGSTTDEAMPTTGSSGTTGPVATTTTGDVTTTGDLTTTGATDPIDSTGLTTTGLTTTGLTTTGLDTAGTTTDMGSSSGDMDTGGGPCQLDQGGVGAEWSLEVPPQAANMNLTLTCTILSSQGIEPKVAVSFSCLVLGVQETVVLHYALLPFWNYTWLQGSQVKIVYHAELAPWGRKWLQITGGLTNFQAVRADELAPPGLSPEEYFGLDVFLDNNPSCEPQPDPCGSRQPLDLHYEHWVGDRPAYVTVQNGEKSSFGFPVRTDIWLEHASELLEPNDCDEVAQRRIDVMIVHDAAGF